MDIGHDLGLFRRRLARLPHQPVVETLAAQKLFRRFEPDRPLHRRADDHARLFHARSRRLDRHRHAQRRPVIGRARGAFGIGRAPVSRRRQRHLDDQLAAFERGLVDSGGELLGRDDPLARRAGGDDRSAERDQHRRQIGVRIGMRQMAAQGRHIAHPHIGQGAQRARDHAKAAVNLRRAFERRKPHHRADAQAAIGPGLDPRQTLARGAQAHQPLGPEQAGFHQQHQRRAAGQRPDRRIAGIEQGESLAERTRLDQIEGRHREPARTVLVPKLTPALRFLPSPRARAWPVRCPKPRPRRSG